MIKERSITIYKIISIVALFIMQVPFFHYAYGGYVKVLLALGMIICFWDVISERRLPKLKNTVNILLVAFSLSYLITILINRDTCFSENIRQLIYMCIFFWLFAMISPNLDLGLIKSDMRKTSYAIVFITFVLSLLSMLMFVFNIYEWYFSDSGVCNYLGRVYGNLYGLYNSNTCGVIALVSLISTLFLIFDNVKIKSKTSVIKIVVLIINTVLQYLVLVLSLSRGSFYAFLVALFVLLSLLIVKTGKVKGIVKKFFAILICLVLIFSLVKVSDIIVDNSDRIVAVSDEDANDNSKDMSYENALEDFLLRYFENTSAIYGSISSDGIGANKMSINTTGRATIWKVGIDAFKSSPVFGLTREGFVGPVSEKVNELMSSAEPYTGVIGGGLHNMYLTILVSSGLVGFITMAIAFGIIFYKFVKVLLHKKSFDLYLAFSFLMVLVFMITELVENRTLYQVTAFNVVFWIYFGYFHYFVKKEYDELKCNAFEKE